MLTLLSSQNSVSVQLSGFHTLCHSGPWWDLTRPVEPEPPRYSRASAFLPSSPEAPRTLAASSFSWSFLGPKEWGLGTARVQGTPTSGDACLQKAGQVGPVKDDSDRQQAAHRRQDARGSRKPCDCRLPLSRRLSQGREGLPRNHVWLGPRAGVCGLITESVRTTGARESLCCWIFRRGRDRTGRPTRTGRGGGERQRHNSSPWGPL